MSLPPAPMPIGVMSATGAVINPLETFFMSINTNPYFIGLSMLLLNLGGRFLPMEISKEQEKVLQNPWFRRALFFFVLFVATRNVFVALIGTIVILLFLSFLFNENSSLCLFKSCDTAATAAKGPDATAAPATQPLGGLTPEEAEILRRLNEKQARMAAATASATAPAAGSPAKEDKTDADIPMEEVYAYNLWRLRS